LHYIFLFFSKKNEKLERANKTLKKNITFFLCANFCRDNEKACALYSPVTGRDTEPPNDVKKARKKRQQLGKTTTKNDAKNTPTDQTNSQKTSEIVKQI